jgi:hypothetical protein
MDESTENKDTKFAVPEIKFYKWEEQSEMRTAEVRALLSTRAAYYTGEAQEAYQRVLQAFDTLWSKRGFDTFPTNKLKAMLVAAAHDVGWYRKGVVYMQAKPKQPDDPNLKTCPTCRETKPRTHFVRKVSPKRARQYGWREDSQIRIAHEQCNYCASPKRKSIAPKRTTPTIANLRHQLNEKLKTTKRMEDSPYKKRKIELLEDCRWRLRDFLDRGVRGPDEWHSMLTKEERNELETLHLRVFWSRRKPDVF